MKKLNFIITLIIGICVLSCSSDDDTITSDNVKLFKKLERYKNGGLFFEKTVNYDSDNKIETIVINKYLGSQAPYTNVITVHYSKNSVSSITDAFNYENPNHTGEEITYDVYFDSNLITLTSEEIVIEIKHSNGYADSLIRYNINNSSDFIDSFLTRDSNQNLISIVSDSGNVVNTYSDFDSDKKPDPDGIVVDVMHRDYLNILGLKLTANNPRISSESILGSTGINRNYTYEYDDEGNITRTYDPNMIFYTDTFYIED